MTEEKQEHFTVIRGGLEDNSEAAPKGREYNMMTRAQLHELNEFHRSLFGKKVPIYNPLAGFWNRIRNSTTYDALAVGGVAGFLVGSAAAELLHSNGELTSWEFLSNFTNSRIAYGSLALGVAVAAGLRFIARRH